MKKILLLLDQWLAYVADVFILLYQYTLSPDKWFPSLRLKGRVCAHEPHCSQYGRQTFKRYGFFGWFFKVMDRVFNCKPSYEKKYDPNHYRVVFFSGAPIGVPFLQELHKDKRYEVVGVVTMPDKARDRGQKVQENVIKMEANSLVKDEKIKNKDLGSFVMTPNKLNPEKSEEGKVFCDRLKSLDADFFVTIAYGKIVPQTVLDIPKFAPVNVHGSLLPKYRGASPIQSVFLHDEQETGLTIMRMVKEMDAGAMIDKLRMKIGFDWTAQTIIEQFMSKGPKFLNKTLWNYAKWLLGEVEQPADKVTFCSKIDKEDGEVDIQTTPLQELYNKYRAYALWPKVYFFLGDAFGNHQGKRVTIESIILDKKLYDSAKDKPLWHNDLHPAVQNLQVKPEGKKSMSWEDFLKGYVK